MPYGFDPELAPFTADLLPEHDLRDTVTSRQVLKEFFSSMPGGFPDTVTVEDRHIPGPGGPVRVRLYAPRERSAEPAPAMVFIHGGGFIVGQIEMGDALLASLAETMGVVSVSVDYRLAPQDPYPAGVEDCYAALVWTAQNAAELGVDPARIAVGGESAGGGLSAAVALLARDRGGPALCLQYLGIPELDDRLDTPSMRAFVDTPGWSRDKAEISWDYYLGQAHRPGGDDVPIYAAPARAEDLSGLPPAYVVVCEFDPLRDEGLAYAARLVQAGVPVGLHMYPGTFHGCSWVPDAQVSRRMQDDLMYALRRAFHPVKAPAAPETAL
ncbi:alpha/beta hydrolase [Streptosporangium sp. NPDC049376]|uniref:alpha/beta hydrolase n=1 Tax=Streptosporangium sp. NPDC049376 TaxID=3366192 RepID=UPI00379BBCFC